MRRQILRGLTLTLAAAAACTNNDATGPKSGGPSFSSSPCSVSGTLQLAVAQTARVDCSNGGSTLTLAGNGASYLIVPQFATSLVPDLYVQYHVSSGTAIAASVSRSTIASLSRAANPFANRITVSASSLPTAKRAKQLAFDRMLRARARQALTSGAWRPTSIRASVTASRSTAPSMSISKVVAPSLGSVRAFRVLSNETSDSFAGVGARLVYAGNNVLIYVDTLAPANGFTSSQLNAFGAQFDQTLYPIDTTAFGPPTDVDQNGRVIMLMTPVVNALTTSSECQNTGYVAGFFNEEDLGAPASDPNSNQGEVFYSIVPDPNGTASCAHSVDEVGYSVPATFMHELQHLISFSQHVVVHNGTSEYGWLDEGLSIVAEELGSVHYEQECPGTACRTDPSQIFPDSSQGFVSNFLYDSYEYALLPDTASLTLHSDDQDGFSWRGGDWLLMRWLGDQMSNGDPMGGGFFRRLDENSLTGVANIENVTGQSFPVLFSNFGLALYTDSLPNEPRTLAPSVDRFLTRNVRQLWNRLWFTSKGSLPLPEPVQLFQITTDTSTAVMDPGTMTFFELDTPTNQATVSIQFSGPGGAALPAVDKPQMAIFRLPGKQ
jgi:hypothetical protein